MTPLAHPVVLLLAAAICLVMAARARGPARGAAALVSITGPVAWGLRLPVPERLAVRLERMGDEGRLERAGLDGCLGVAELGRARAALALWTGVVALAIGAVFIPLAVAALPAVVAAAWMVDRSLSGMARARQGALVRELPDLLDLLGICVASGMALDPALGLAAERLGGVLGDEVHRTMRDLRLGTPRADAYRALATRTGSAPLADAVGALLQAEELGTPLSGALAQQADTLRSLRRQAARDRAATAAPKIQLVVALVMVPAVMILVMGVLVIELARQVGAVVGQ